MSSISKIKIGEKYYNIKALKLKDSCVLTNNEIIDIVSTYFDVSLSGSGSGSGSGISEALIDEAAEQIEE